MRIRQGALGRGDPPQPPDAVRLGNAPRFVLVRTMDLTLVVGGHCGLRDLRRVAGGLTIE